MSVSQQPVVIGDGPSGVITPRAYRIQRRLKLLLMVVAPLILLLSAALAIGLWFQLEHRLAQAEVKKELARLKAAGEPMSTAELYAWHRVPKGTKDSTRFWLEALNSYNPPARNDPAATLPFLGDGDERLLQPEIQDSQFETARQYLVDHQLTLELARVAAAQGGECRFPLNFEQGIMTLLPHAQKCSDLRRLLALSARIHTHEDKASEALATLDVMFSLGNMLQHQPIGVEQNIGNSAITWALRELAFTIGEAELSDEQLRDLQETVRTRTYQADLSQAMIAERALGWHAFHHPELIEQVYLGAPSGPEMNFRERPLTRPIDGWRYLQTMAELKAAATLPASDGLAAAKAIEAWGREMKASNNPLDRFKYRNTVLLTSASSTHFGPQARMEARRDLMLCLIAAERYRLANGGLPTSLQQLVPAYLPVVPNDPFDGRPVRMKVLGDELVFYSVGEDGKDDGGQEKDNENRPDLVARLRLKKVGQSSPD